MREEQFGTLTIRLAVHGGSRTRWVTLRKATYVSRDSCDAELEIFFEDNRSIRREQCAIEWVFTDVL